MIEAKGHGESGFSSSIPARRERALASPKQTAAATAGATSAPPPPPASVPAAPFFGISVSQSTESSATSVAFMSSLLRL